jgi:hypothetical protein
MLTLLLGFKMLEMRARRDVMVVIFLCYFVLLSNYFYSQSMLMALHSILTLALMLSAQLSFQYGAYQPPLRQRLALVGRLLLYGAPLALLLFLGFPRISGPLWGLPGDAHTGSSGLSDSMAPGSISTLARSDALAFRVQFQGPHPSPSQLYWRTIVLGDYDGRSWTRVHPGRGLHRADLDIRVRNPALAYELTLEVQQQPYLPALELSGPQLQLDNYRVVDTDEMEFVTTRTPGERLRYRSRAWLTYRLQAEASRATLQRWLELPDGYNPRTLALAAQLSADHAAAPMLVERLLQRCSAPAAIATRWNRPCWAATPSMNSCSIAKPASANTSPAPSCSRCAPWACRRAWSPAIRAANSIRSMACSCARPMPTPGPNSGRPASAGSASTPRQRLRRSASPAQPIWPRASAAAPSCCKP